MQNETLRGKVCSRCSADLLDDGLCPACLFSLALEQCVMNYTPISGFETTDYADYEILEIIGRGGNGIVFRVRHRQTGNIFALKRLASVSFAGPDELRRFRLEAQTLRELDHPAIIRINDIGEADGCPFYVMDYAGGGTLAQLLNEGLGLEDGVKLLVNVARAVHHAHERGVLHRDLKPENILLDSLGQALVSDFGLVRLADAEHRYTLTGAALGTPSYMSPEQAAGNTITTATDQFSLGAILYHILCGRPPFVGATPMETLRQLVSSDAPDPRALTPGLSADLARICVMSLRREPSGRYSSVAAFADDLERWLDGAPVAARPLGYWEKSIRWARRRPVISAVSATGALALIVLLSMFIAGSWMLREERNHALHLEGVAKRREQESIKERDRSALNAYAADMYLGYRAFEDGHIGLARTMLRGLSPKTNQQDLRGFEWHLLNRLCRGNEAQVFKDHSAAVTSVVFSPSSNAIATAGMDGKVIVRSFPAGEKLLELPKLDAPKGAAEIPQMAFVLRSSAEASARVLSGKLNPDEFRMRSRPSRLSEISVVAWSPSGDELLTAGGGGYVRVWKMPIGELIGVIPVYAADEAGFSADGQRVFVLAKQDGETQSSELRIYRRSDLSLERTITGLRDTLAHSPARDCIAVISQEQSEIEIHFLSASKAPIKIPVDQGLIHLEFSAEGEKLFAREFLGTRIWAWDVKTGAAPILTHAADPNTGTFRISPDGTKIISTGEGQIISVTDVENSTIKLLRGHDDTILDQKFSPDGSWLITGGKDGTCRIWSVESMKNIYPNHPAEFPKTKFFTDGIPWRGDGTTKSPLQRIREDGTVERTIPPPPKKYLRLVSSPDGNVIGAIQWPRSAWFFDTGEQIWSGHFELGSGVVGPVVISPDRKWAAHGGDDFLVTVIELRDGREVARLSGHQGQIMAIAFSPDMQTLVSSSADGVLRFWHVPTWRPLGGLRVEKFRKLAFSHDGTLLRAEAPDGMAYDFPEN